MKPILAFLLLSLTFLLASEDTFKHFLDGQIAMEAKLLDQNLTTKERKEIRKRQDSDYRTFFIEYASDKDNYSDRNNTYSKEISKLEIKRNYDLRRKRRLAAMRDEIKIYEYRTRQKIESFLRKVLLQTNSRSRSFFEDKIGDMITSSFSNYTPIDKQKYLEALEHAGDSEAAAQLRKELKNLEYLESIINTFSAQLINKSTEIYNVGKITQSKFYAIIDKINQSPYAKKLNKKLANFNIDTAHLALFFMIILVIVIFNTIVRFLIDHMLRFRKVSEDEISYIHSHITKLIYIGTSILIVHLSLVLYFGLDIKSVMLSKFFAIIYVFLIALILYRITNTVAYLKMEKLQQSKILKKEVFNLLIKLINTLIILVAIIAILIIFGVDLTALLSGLGIGGFAVAFAAKDSIANIFGSISILMGDLFEQGDWIEAGGIDGTVVEIGLRATTLRTFDNALVSIPNFKLVNDGIKNWSRRNIGRRIKMHIGVTYESDFNDIRRAIKEIRIMLKEHQGIAGSGTAYRNKHRSSRLVSIEDFKGIKRFSLVYMDEFADSSINILVYCFSKSVVWSEWLEVKEDVMYRIAEILKRNHLQFAYPAIAVHQVADPSCAEATTEKSRSEPVPRMGPPTSHD